MKNKIIRWAMIIPLIVFEFFLLILLFGPTFVDIREHAENVSKLTQQETNQNAFQAYRYSLRKYQAAVIETKVIILIIASANGVLIFLLLRYFLTPKKFKCGDQRCGRNIDLRLERKSDQCGNGDQHEHIPMGCSEPNGEFHQSDQSKFIHI